MDNRGRKKILSRALSIALLPFLVLVVIPLVLIIYVHPLFDPLHVTYPLTIPFMVAGMLFIIPGIILLAAAIRMFHGPGRGTLAPWDPPKRLVTGGPYRYIRNPMISGVLFVLLGESVLFVSAVLFFWCIFFLIGNIIYFIFLEEPGMEKRFGEDYTEYKEKVPMFIPRCKRYRGRP